MVHFVLVKCVAIKLFFRQDWRHSGWYEWYDCRLKLFLKARRSMMGDKKMPN